MTTARYAMKETRSRRKNNGVYVNGTYPNLVFAEGMFLNSYIRKYSGTLRSLTEGKKMFDSCPFLKESYIYGCKGLTDASFMYDTCKSLIKVEMPHTESLANAEGMFKDCKRLKEVTLCNSYIRNMNNMFSGTGNVKMLFKNGLNGPNDLSPGDPKRIPNAVSAQYAWSNSKIKSFKGYTFAALEDATGMFEGCKELKAVTNCKFDVLTTATNMYKDCQKLMYDANKYVLVTSVSGIYTNCDSMVRNSSSFPSLTNTSNLFTDCKDLKLSIHDANEAFKSAVNTNGMYSGCSKLEKVYGINSNTTNLMVKEVAGIDSALPLLFPPVETTDMFAGCTSLKMVALRFSKLTALTDELFADSKNSLKEAYISADEAESAEIFL